MQQARAAMRADCLSPLSVLDVGAVLLVHPQRLTDESHLAISCGLEGFVVEECCPWKFEHSLVWGWKGEELVCSIVREDVTYLDAHPGAAHFLGVKLPTP